MATKNVLMISVDDLNSWVTFQDNYSGEIHAPNIERLMGMGTNFANAFCQTAVCNPSRASVLTGTAPASTGVYDNAVNWYDALDPSETLPAVLNSTMELPRTRSFFRIMCRQRMQ
jgi:arylsulfatase A-like enzyme